MKMSQPLRIDYPPGMGSFVTRRIRNSQLVYANNKPLQDRVLGAMGKYIDKYQPKIYAFTFFGSHDHSLMCFEPKTKSKFFRDLGARTAEAVKRFVPEFGTGTVFERRTSEQAITSDTESHLDRLMYTILQPIAAGLCKDLDDYPGFNSYNYILSGEPLDVGFFNADKYNRARRKNKDVDPELYVEKFQIKFIRVPGCEKMTQQEYASFIQDEFEKRRKLIIEEFDAAGHVWPDVSKLKLTKSTDKAKNPKRSTRHSPRPLVLSVCMERRQEFLNYYFSTLEKFKLASAEFLAGNRNVEFPTGTCIPPGPWC